MTGAIILYILGAVLMAGLHSQYIEETGEMKTWPWKILLVTAWPLFALMISIGVAFEYLRGEPT